MFPERTIVWASLLLAVGGAGLAACFLPDSPPEVTSAAPASSNPVPASTKNRLKFKGGVRYATDLSTSLGLAKNEICKELSQYDCADVVHNVSLGGVEPYRITVYTPIADRSVASANAVDRMALSACDLRASRDLETPSSALVFGELLGGAEPDAGVLGRLADGLYAKLLGRAPSAAERSALVDFYATLQETAGAETTRRYATLACFVVATSEEALFY